MKVIISDKEGKTLVSYPVDVPRIMQAVTEALKYGPLTDVGNMRTIKNILYDDTISNLEDDLVTLILRGEK